MRDRPLAAYGADAAGLALLLTSLSDDVVLLTNGDSNLESDDVSELEAAGVVIRDDPVARLESEDGRLARIRFADGSSDDRAGLFYAPRFTPSPLPAQLGCELDDDGMMVIDDDGRTSVPGVFGAGDATVGKAAVVLAAAAGSRAAYAINAGLAHGTLPGGGSRTRSAIHVLSNGVINLAPDKGAVQTGERTMTATTNPNKTLWEKGDFTQIAGSLRESGEALVSKLGITEGLQVLDLGCGDGTTAVPAAQLGADVLGVDIASNLVAAGKARAKDLGLANLFFSGGRRYGPERAR